MPKEGRLFNLGMNKDVSPHLLKNGMYVDAFNLHIGKTANGVDLTAENVKSTKEADDSYTLPSGVNRIIGMWDDVKGRRTIIFLWNSEGSHRLIEYNYTTEEITTIIEDNDYSPTTWTNSGVKTWGVVYQLSGDTRYWYCNYSHTANANNGPGDNSYFFDEIGDYLDFQENSFPQINGIYRDDELLIYWTDNNSEPKYINVDRFLNGTDGEDYPSVIKNEYLLQIPAAPTFCIRNAVYGNDSSGGVEIIKNYYQFRYQWEYWDGRKSTWSPISKIPMPTKNIRGRNSSTDNKITLEVQRPNYSDTSNASVIKKIYVAAMEVSSGNSGTWYKCGEINATKYPDIDPNYGSTSGAATTGYTYDFVFRGQNSGAIDSNEITQYFSWIPQKAASQEIIDDNTLILGGITEGYDNINPEPNEFNANTDVSVAANTITITAHGYSTGDNVSYNNGGGTTITPLNNNQSYYVIKVDNNTIQLAESYDDAIDGTNIVITVVGSGTQTLSSFRAEVSWTWTTINSSTNKESGPVSVFKRGHRYKFGLVYGDAYGRISDVVTSDDLDVICPFYDSSLASNPNHYIAPIPTITIYTTPPLWADRYYIVYSRSLTAQLDGSTPKFQQFMSWDALTYGGVTTAWEQHNTNQIHFGLGYVNQLGNQYPAHVGNVGRADKFSAYNMSNAYSPQDGDRLRIIAGFEDQISTNTYATSIYDVEIDEYITNHGWLLLVAYDQATGNYYTAGGGTAYAGVTTEIPVIRVRRGFDGNAIIGTPATTGTFPPDCYTGAATTTDSNFLIEVYTPSSVSEESLSFYEIGESFRCGYDTDGNWVHYAMQDDSGNNTDQSLDTTIGISPAIIEIISGGDCYLNMRYVDTLANGSSVEEPTSTGIPTDSGKAFVGPISVETSSIEDYLINRSNNSGRANIIDVDSSQHIETQRPATIRFSQPLQQGTNINGFGTFYDLDFFDANVNHGRINKLFSQKEYLTVFQETRTSTIPINRIQWSDAGGATTVALSTSLLGAIQYFPQQFGIGENATSHSAYGEKQFFYDLRRNAILMIRGSSQLDVISELGADSWVDNISEISNGYVNRPKIYGVYDQEFMEYISCVDYSAIANGAVSNVDAGSSQITVTVSADQWSAFSLSVDTGSTVTVRYDDSGTTAETTESVNAYPLNAITLDVSDTSIYTVSEALQIRYEQKDTIAYSDKYGFWSGRYPFTPEMFGAAGTKVLSSNNGVLWVHNDGDVSTYGNIYGTAYAATIQFPFNESPATVKNPLNIEIRTNDLENWSVTEIINNTGQQSSLETTDFTSIEGVLYAPILRDINTPNKTNPITQGDKLFGEYHLVTLSNDSTDYVRLYSSGLNYTPSYLP